jgi:hypothetical protein
MKLVALEADKLRIDEGVLDVSMSMHLHDVQNVFGSVILHDGFLMSESMEGYAAKLWILKFLSHPHPVSLKCPSEGVEVYWEDSICFSL